jgi:hypothetical protein
MKDRFRYGRACSCNHLSALLVRSRFNTSKEFARGTATSPWLLPRLHARGLFETLRAYRRNSNFNLAAQQVGDCFDRFVPVLVGPSHKKHPVVRFAGAKSIDISTADLVAAGKGSV